MLRAVSLQTGTVTTANIGTYAWALGGNSVASAQNIGTTTNFDFPIITNNGEAGRFTTGNQLILGHTASIVTNSITPKLEVFGTDANTSTIGTYRYSANSAMARVIISKSRGASIGTHAAVINNDGLGSLDFNGSTGASYSLGAQIVAEAEGTFTGSANATRLRILTGLSTGGSTEALRIDSNQVMTTTSGQIVKTRVVTAAGAVTVAVTDLIIIVNKTVGAATTVNLPASPVTGTRFTVKDGKGDAAANNITVTPAAGTIDGAATNVINANYGVRGYLYNGTEWNTF